MDIGSESSNFEDSNITDVTSDVHLERAFWIEEDHLYASRYEIDIPRSKCNAEDETEYGNQGDPRRRRKKMKYNSSCFVIIHHMNSTSVNDVGKQLWRGAFLLSDYLVYMHEYLKTRHLFEFGCGVGFVGKVASLLPCKSVYITDATSDLVEIAAKNIERNEHLAPLYDTCLHAAHVYPRVLNWFDASNSRESLLGSGGWTADDIAVLSSNKTEVLWLAADVIYDDALTEAFFKTARRCMRPGEHLWMAMEKRFNFSIEEMSVVAHGYKRLLKYIGLSPSQTTAVLEVEVSHFSHDVSSHYFTGKRIPLTFPQRVMNYDRVKDLEMWDITRTQAI